MSSYNANIPNATDIPAQSQPLLKLNFQYLQSFGIADHNFSGISGGADGFHNKVTFVANTAAPGFGAGVSDLFVNTVNGRSSLWFQNALGNFSVTGTNPLVAANGSTCLPGGILIQWGSVAVAAGGSAFLWPIAFTTFYSATLTVRATANNDARIASFLNSPTATGGTIFVLNQAPSPRAETVFFIAIGAKP